MKENINRPPIITLDTLKYLDTLFPYKSINSDTTMQEIYFNGGSRKVIDHMKYIYDKQQENS